MLVGTGGIKRVAVVYLPPGSDIVEGIREAAERDGIRSGLVLGGAASLRRVTLRNCRGFKDALPLDDNYRVYSTTEGPYELIGLTGNIATAADGSLSVHIHATVSAGEPAAIAYGGHLIAAQVYTLAEIAIAEIEGMALRRLLDPATGTPHLVPETE